MVKALGCVPAFAGSIPVVRPLNYSVSKKTFKYFAKVIASSSILFNAIGSSIPFNGISRPSVKRKSNCLLGLIPSFMRNFMAFISSKERKG